MPENQAQSRGPKLSKFVQGTPSPYKNNIICIASLACILNVVPVACSWEKRKVSCRAFAALLERCSPLAGSEHSRAVADGKQPWAVNFEGMAYYCLKYCCQKIAKKNLSKPPTSDNRVETTSRV